MRGKARTLDIGSVSHGTMRPEDLIPEFLYHAERLRLSADDRRKIRTIRAELNKDDGFGSDYWRDGGADEDLSTLFDILGNYVPPFCYFGAHEGDGADYGVWPSMESLDDAVEQGEIRRESSDGMRHYVTDNSAPGAPWRYRMVVSDHGNVSLYYRNGREVWGIV